MMRSALFVVRLLLALAIGSRADAAVFSCDAAGVVAAVAAGGGPHTFSCGGPTTVTLPSELLLTANVVLDGEDRLTLSGDGNIRLFGVPAGRTLELRNLVLREGYAADKGGCIQVAAGASLIVADSTITRCRADEGGGAIYSEGSVTITDSTISRNSATESGGGIASGDVDAPVVGPSLDVSGSRIVRNTLSLGSGGGIASLGGSLSLVASDVSGNHAFGAGGVYASGASTLVGVTVSFNDAWSGGGGLTTSGTFPIVISGSTISDNSAESEWTLGGGIFNLADSLTIRSSTITRNQGGGISNAKNLVLEHTTISANPSTRPTALYRTGTVTSQTFRNTLIDGTCTNIPKAGVFFISQGGNVQSPDNSCQLTHATDQVGVSPAALHLGELGPHGGATRTIPLLPASVALDAANGCTSATDQRGVARPFGTACDVGAYEWDDPQPQPPLPVPALPPAALAALFLACAVLGARALVRR